MIKISNVTKKYSNGVVSLDNVSLEIPRSSVLGLVGTNGAGKSTLLRILAGILKEDDGRIEVSGEEVFENSTVKEKISFISDEGYLIPQFTLKMMADIYASVRKNFSHEKFNALCEKMRLDQNRRISTFSKGMKRQGEVILALSSNTEYLFFDETFDGLDPIARESARSMIADCVLDSGATVILSSHNLSEIENICDSIALLDAGHLLFHKSIMSALDDYKKYQLVFDEECDLENVGTGFERMQKSGKLLTFISSLDEEKVLLRINALVPERQIIYCENVPLSLEEIFSLEVEKSHIRFN